MVIMNLFIRIKKYRQQKMLLRAIRKADKMAQLTGMKFLVLRYRNRFLVKSKRELKYMIRQGFFVSGFTIGYACKMALYITQKKGRRCF
jgi:hypothetical protein